MNKTLPILTLAMVLLFAVSAIAADKVVVIPLNTSSNADGKLWGQGRPGVVYGTWTWYTSPADQNIEYSPSTMMTDWGSSPAACPAGTWVCPYSDITGQIPDILSSYSGFDCNGNPLLATNVAWLATAFNHWGLVKQSGGTTPVGHDPCEILKVWCCRAK